MDGTSSDRIEEIVSTCWMYGSEGNTGSGLATDRVIQKCFDDAVSSSLLLGPRGHLPPNCSVKTVNVRCLRLIMC